jgi:hypothetical protein
VINGCGSCYNFMFRKLKKKKEEEEEEERA